MVGLNSKHIILGPMFPAILSKDVISLTEWESKIPSISDKLEISNKLLKEMLSKKYYKTIVMVDSWLANAGEVVAQTGYNDINILGFDLMPQNKEALKQGKVTYIIDQSAYMESYECVHKVCEHLIYGTELPKGKNYLPIHIYNKYNLDWFFRFYKRWNWIFIFKNYLDFWLY